MANAKGLTGRAAPVTLVGMSDIFGSNSILWILFVGLVIGIIAKFLMPGRDPGGCIITMLIGVAGSVVAYFLGQKMGWYQAGEPVGFIASVVGAMLLLLLYRIIAPKRQQ